jgi:hypothetical protein
LTLRGNQHGEFHRQFFPLTIASSRSAGKRFAAETLRVNSPPSWPYVALRQQGENFGENL